ncbi:S1C family serine protease [Ferviditalea candida]|uniref:Trypsin-like peptidase domain-containing protein n=1 Tax=Ferviditalea candida TaxID=3108399 RepID=A0ABU5ZJM1_9BACL|nr:trypsin-like peptidase domain-containing protein [Paenibacillaceae bacterium T2]
MRSSFIRIFSVMLVLTMTYGLNAEAVGSVGQSMDMDAKLINGEVYVKASSMVQALGGSGKYDSKSGKFHYTGSIPDVIDKVSPSVVAIIGKPSNVPGSQDGNRFQLAHGTGVIVKADGWIITNAHVVKDMKNIVVVTSDGKQYAGKQTNIDEESDLALVKINASGLTPAKFNTDGHIRVGETVIAMGTPISFALRNSATVGVISGMNRAVNSNYRLLQTDAAINPGNSGGPLINLNGEVVGINSLKFVEVSVDNMGFAVPADTVQYVLKHFWKYGKVKRPDPGFLLEESWESVVGLPSNEPLKVTAVQSTSSAYEKGVREGDILYSIENSNVSTITDMNELLKNYLPGDKVQMMFQSNGDLVKRVIILGEK